jgi:hypothetical protein
LEAFSKWGNTIPVKIYKNESSKDVLTTKFGSSKIDENLAPLEICSPHCKELWTKRIGVSSVTK